jgi:hypothetical protein
VLSFKRNIGVFILNHSQGTRTLVRCPIYPMFFVRVHPNDGGDTCGITILVRKVRMLYVERMLRGTTEQQGFI